jgi:hypothetical protein
MEAGPAELPRWVLRWTAALVAIQAWHAVVVALLPATLPGGSLGLLALPFHPFMELHRAYGMPGDGILVACTWLDALEILVLAAALPARGWTRARLLALGHAMYAYKVLVVFSIEVGMGRPYTGHADLAAWLAVYLLPQVVMGGLAGVAAWAALGSRSGGQ